MSAHLLKRSLSLHLAAFRWMLRLSCESMEKQSDQCSALWGSCRVKVLTSVFQQTLQSQRHLRLGRLSGDWITTMPSVAVMVKGQRSARASGGALAGRRVCMLASASRLCGNSSPRGSLTE